MTAPAERSVRLKMLPDTVRSLLIERSRLIYLFSENVDSVWLFGSYASGTATAESDIDIAVFMSGEKNFFLEEYRAFSHICKSGEYDFQVQVFSASELASPNGIVTEVVENGFIIDRETALHGN